MLAQIILALRITHLPLASDGSSLCASLVLLGNMKSGNNSFKKGTVIVMWDTSKGTFTGERLQ